MKKRLLSVLLTLLMVFTMIPFFGINVSSAGDKRAPKLTNPAVPYKEIVNTDKFKEGSTYRGQLQTTVSNSSKLRIRWEDVGASSYKVAVKALDGEPVNENDLGNDEPGESLYPYTTGYTKTYIDLTAAQIKKSAGKWIKVFVQAYYAEDDEYAGHYYFKIKPLDDTLTEPDITVIAVNSSSIEISWNKVSGATMYDIYRSTTTTASTFKLVKSTSATSWTDTGLAASTRYYYKVKARNSSTESGFSNRDYDTTDAASEGRFDSAPTLSLGAYGNKLGTDYYGPYTAGDTVYFYFTADNSDHVFVQTSSTDLKFDDADGNPTYAGTFVEKTSPSESDAKERYTNGTRYQVDVKVPRGIESGDYTITVTATDGVYDPDLEGSIAGTSQYPSVKKSVKIKVIETSSGGTGKVFSSYAEAENAMVSYPKKLDWSEVGIINYVAQMWGSSPQATQDDYMYYGEQGYWSTLEQAKSACTRAASCMAISYMGITALPKNVNPTDAPYEEYATKTLGLTLFGNDSSSISLSTFNEWYDRYAMDTLGEYSPIILHTNYNTDSMHAVAVFGRDANDENCYYVVDSGGREHVAKVRIVEVNGKIRIGEYLIRNNDKKNTKYSSAYGMIGVWQYGRSNAAPTATITYNANGGSNAPASASGKVGETVKLSTSVPTRTNYKFKGWSTSSGASTPEYASGASYKLTGNVTLYAVWEKIESSTHIRGDANGDGVKNISDFTYVLVHIVTNGVVNKVEESVDYNGDGAVTMADATYLLINIVTNGLVNGNLH